MQFTGTELSHFRNFYTQNDNFEVDVNFIVDNTTGHYVFGLTGSNTNFKFDLISGKIYDPNGLFVHSYLPNENVNLQLQITSDSYNIYKNNIPLVLGNNKSNQDYNQFFFNRQYNTDSATFDVYISGQNQPNIYFDQNAYLLSTGQNMVTGQIINNGDYDYRVFNSISNNSQNLSYNNFTGIIPPGSTDYFIYSGDFTNFDFTAPTFPTFYTNYDYNTFNFYIVNTVNANPFVLMQPITNYSFNGNNQFIRTISYNNYSSGLLSNSFNADFYFQLDFISGFTGVPFVSGALTGNFYGQGSGYIEIDGFTGITSGGFVGQVTGYGEGSSTFQFTGNVTGLNVGSQGEATIATGFIDLSNIYLTGQYSFDDRRSQAYPAIYYGNFIDNNVPVEYDPILWFMVPFQSPTANNSQDLIDILSSDTKYGMTGQIYSDEIYATGWIDISNIKTGDYTMTYPFPAYNQEFLTKGGFDSPSNSYFSTSSGFAQALNYFTTGTLVQNYGTNILWITGQRVDDNIINLFATKPGSLGNSIELVLHSSISGTVTGSNYDYKLSGVRLQGGFSPPIYLAALQSGVAGNSGYLGVSLENYGFWGTTLGYITGTNFYSGPGHNEYSHPIMLNSISLIGGSDGEGGPSGILFTGYIDQTITGILPITGYISSWNFLTGLNPNNLASLKTDGNYDKFSISGSGQFTPNNSFSLQINNNGMTGNIMKLTISGDNIYNPISQLIYN